MFLLFSVKNARIKEVKKMEIVLRVTEFVVYVSNMILFENAIMGLAFLTIHLIFIFILVINLFFS